MEMASNQQLAHCWCFIKWPNLVVTTRALQFRLRYSLTIGEGSRQLPVSEDLYRQAIQFQAGGEWLCLIACFAKIDLKVW